MTIILCRVLYLTGVDDWRLVIIRNPDRRINRNANRENMILCIKIHTIIILRDHLC